MLLGLGNVCRSPYHHILTCGSQVCQLCGLQQVTKADIQLEIGVTELIPRRKIPPAVQVGLTDKSGIQADFFMFAVITVDDEQRHATTLKKRTSSPYWNESFALCVQQASPLNGILD